MHNILILDDDRCVLDTLYRSLKKEPYTLMLADSPQEALDILANNMVSLVISDVKMPKMNGIEFLQQAGEFSPESVKMLLSGYSEVDLMVDAINKAKVWRYIPKPWNNEELLLAVRNGIEHYELQQERKELLNALEKKNLELVELNDNLEEKVKQRTRQIDCHMNLLMQLLNGVDYKTFIREIIPGIRDMFQAEKVSIFICNTKERISQCDDLACEYVSVCDEQVRAAIITGEVQSNDHTCVVPVSNDQEVFAVIVVREWLGDFNSHKSELDGILIILKIAIQREVMKNRASSMIGDIEKLLERC